MYIGGSGITGINLLNEKQDMTAIGSLVFCTACGDLLEESSGDRQAILKCEVCGTDNRGENCQLNIVHFDIVLDLT